MAASSTGPATSDAARALGLSGPAVEHPRIVSCSRRNDYPACYPTLVVDALTKGYILFSGARGVKRIVCFDQTLAWVWWSKDYRPLLNEWAKAPALFRQTKAHIFHFTVTGLDLLEKGVVSTLDDRLHQILELQTLGTVIVRLDPLMRINVRGQVSDNVVFGHQLMQWLGSNSTVGVQIKTKFYIAFAKSEKRLQKCGIANVPVSSEEQVAIMRALGETARANGQLLTPCAESANIVKTPSGGHRVPIVFNGCIDICAISLILGVDPSLLGKIGKGTRSGCTCSESTDIGEYNRKCNHSCIYCYANPKELEW